MLEYLALGFWCIEEAYYKGHIVECNSFVGVFLKNFVCRVQEWTDICIVEWTKPPKPKSKRSKREFENRKPDF